MNQKPDLKRLTVTAIMAAAACVLGPVSVPLPISLVPISACTLVFYLFSYLLRARECVAACVVYMLLGIAGLPVFTGFRSGIAVFAGPTAGYLLGYLFLCLLCPLVINRWPAKRGLHLRHDRRDGRAVAFGTVWYAVYAGIGVGAALAAAILPFSARRRSQDRRRGARRSRTAPRHLEGLTAAQPCPLSVCPHEKNRPYRKLYGRFCVRDEVSLSICAVPAGQREMRGCPSFRCGGVQSTQAYKEDAKETAH